MTVTMKDVAKAAGVSQTAVSLTLNNRPGHVSRSMRTKIDRIAAEMGYRPNLSARMLRGKSGKTIGILGSLFSVPIHSCLIHEITCGLWGEGYQTILEETQSNPVEEKRRIGDLLARGVDGIIFSNYCDRRNFESLPVPYVVLGHDQEISDCKTDSQYGGKLAGNHFIEHGRTLVGFITSGPFSNIGKMTGLESSLAESGLGSLSFLVELLHNPRATDDIITAIKNGVNALFCTNDIIAGKLLALLAGKGIKVPEDVAVIGYDGLTFTEFTCPALTTIIQPLEPIAALTVELILNRINSNDIKPELKNIKIKPRLNIGGSCGCPNPVPEDLFWEGTPMFIGGAPA